jgi:Protein of unknown function (DUF3341)
MAMHGSDQPGGRVYGVMAEFESAQQCVDAARRVAAEGFTNFEAYTPVPVEELNAIIHVKRTRLPMATLAGGLTGMATGFALQYWVSVISYPIVVGGRPLASWPSFVVPSYELTILFASITATLFMILANGLPQPYHPVFNVERFSLASSDKFFLVVEAIDPKFDRGSTMKFLEGVGGKGVYEVPE